MTDRWPSHQRNHVTKLGLLSELKISLTNAIYRLVAHGVEVRNAHRAKGRAAKEIRSKGTDILDETKKMVTFL